MKKAKQKVNKEYNQHNANDFTNAPKCMLQNNKQKAKYTAINNTTAASPKRVTGHSNNQELKKPTGIDRSLNTKNK